MDNIIPYRIWKPLNDPKFGFMDTFSQSVQTLEVQQRNSLPNLRETPLILVASDYSGKHNIAHYQSLSFLFVDLENCTTWENQRKQLRQRFLRDGRRMSFKNLNDNQRQKALPSFLKAANTIPGLNVTILIDKDIKSLFEYFGKIDMSKPELQIYDHWSPSSFEKMLRVIHFVSFFIAGLSRKNQDVIWFTDEDEIVANQQRLIETTNIWGNVISHYLKHNLGHLRLGTTKSDDGSRQIEDLVAVPDLIAGALTEVLTTYKNNGLLPNSSLITPVPQNLSKKAFKITSWFANDTHPLKRFVYVIEPVKGSQSMNLKLIKFH